MKAPVLAAVVVLASAATARADVISFRAEAHGGGVGGTGLKGDQKDDAFFKGVPHGVYGALVGVEVFFIDVWIEHHQFTDGSRISTWTKIATGLDIQIPVGDEGQKDAAGKKPGPQNYVELGFAGAFGVGTGQQVDPPLDNGQITDKGLLLEGDFAFGHKLAKGVDVGLRVPVSVGYFFKSGNGATVNDLSTHYSGLQAEALLYLRLHLNLE